MRRSVSVSIAGIAFSVRTDAEPKYVRELAAHVEDTIIKGSQNKGPSTQKAILLAAMSITDELMQLKERHEALRHEVQKRSRRILDTLDEKAKA